MRRAAMMMLTGILAATAPAQRPGGAIWNILDELGGNQESPPTLQEIFGDIGVMLKSADKSKVKVMEARLAETEEEIRHLENLQSALERGIIVDMPEVLKQRLDAGASESSLKQEETQVAELQAKERLLRARRTRLANERSRGEIAKVRRPTRFGAAALDVALEVPEPPKSGVGSEERIADAVDKVALAKALYFAEDYAGALKAFQRVLAKERTAEITFRMARCHDKLGRWKEAEELYVATQGDDPQGHWGNQAKWSLDLGKQRERIRKLLAGGKGTT